MYNISIAGINVDIHKGPLSILHSGGADSAILLYILMMNVKETITVITCANKLKGRINPKIATNVISKCIDLTNNSNIIHSTFFVEEQTFNSLFGNVNKYFQSKQIIYTGATAFPPDTALSTFKNTTEIYSKRDPNKVRELYNGRFYAPFFNHNKKHIYNLYADLNLLDELYPITRSCEDLELREGHCGKCWWCEERHWAFGHLQ